MIKIIGSHLNNQQIEIDMTFDIHQLDKLQLEPGTAEAENAMQEYKDAVLEQFFDSPEGQTHREADPNMGFWVEQLIYYGYSHIGVTLPRMNVGNIDEIVTELFPRKISISAPEDAENAIPELLAFWKFLERMYELPNAKPILVFLDDIEAEFGDIMNDPSNFGMAKSFFMMGREAGFDMSNPDESSAFAQHFNAKIARQRQDLSFLSDESEPSNFTLGAEGAYGAKKASAKRKKRRKIAKASRKANKRRRK